MKRKKIYPALVRWAYATNRENEFISIHQQKLIPKQTKSNWRKTTRKEIHLLEQELEIRDQLVAIAEAGDLQMRERKKVFYTLYKLHLHFIHLVGKDKFLKLLSNNKFDVVNIIENYALFLPKEFLQRWFRISKNRYEKWHTQALFDCSSSIKRLCSKKFPMQISKREFNKIKAGLNNKDYENWPLSSIHSRLLRNKKLNVSRATFYRYAKLIEPNRKYYRNKPKYEPLRANYPNEIWHADFSKFKTRDGNTAIIYMLIDNYSRKILAWRCEKRVAKEYVSEIICEAAEKESKRKLDLITDGGTENVNHLIDRVIMELNKHPDSNIEHKIALKDIKQSNSMIERVFRVMKSGYLYKTTPDNYEDLCSQIESLVIDYNFERPHYANNHLTPHEKHIGFRIPDLSLQIKRALKSRRKANKNCPCKVCDCDLGKPKK